MEVVANIIYSYLEENRRITIPTLGTFLTKGGRGTILFSEFMKGDDGVLRTLLVDSGLSDEVAMTTIEQFVNDIRAKLSRDGYCEIPPMGVFMTNGTTISFCIVEPKVEEPQEVEPQAEEVSADKSIVTPEEEAKIVESIFESLSSHIDEPIGEEVSEDEVAIEDEDEEFEDDEPSQEREKPKYDIWFLMPVAAAIMALFALLYGVVVEWQVGNISFGRAIDGVLISIFG